MYLTRHAQLFLVKRMHGTGHRHHPACQSCELEGHSSGLGELIDEAVLEPTPGPVVMNEKETAAKSRVAGETEQGKWLWATDQCIPALLAMETRP